ncbi:MAG: DUF115 domain-containing protein [Treponema sp.]|nr:DUF115 domain-containing protein [Treponema sp.]
MTERLLFAKNGSPIVLCGGTALHSRYDPQAEAERYVSALSLDKSLTAFILVENALAYLADALKKKFPRSRVISLHSSAFYSQGGAEKASRLGPAAVWTPGKGIALDDFLEEILDGTAFEQIKLIEWRPGVNAYGEKSVRLLSGTLEILQRLHANEVTKKAFSLRWFRNFLRSLNLLGGAVSVQKGNCPAVMCASGPSLEEALPLILQKRKGLFVAAVSSSVPALLKHGVAPDLVAATDGGAWALRHLYESCRAFYDKNIVYAAALSAALPSQLDGKMILPICDGSLYQQLVLRALPVPSLTFPQRGMVGAAALDLVMALTSGPVYTAGLDFEHRDLYTHARPYAFEPLIDENANRFFPFYTRVFEREAAIRTGNANRVYKSWFKSHRARYGERLFTLSGGKDLTLPKGRMEQTPVFTRSGTSMAKNAGESAKVILKNALKDSRLKRQLEDELGEALAILENEPVNE